MLLLEQTMMQKKVRVIGIGVMNNETCVYCGGEGRIYVSDNKPGMKPACNKCVGNGAIGEMADIIRFPVGSLVKIKNWPVDGQIIGYTKDDMPIVQPEAMQMDPSEIEFEVKITVFHFDRELFSSLQQVGSMAEAETVALGMRIGASLCSQEVWALEDLTAKVEMLVDPMRDHQECKCYDAQAGYHTCPCHCGGYDGEGVCKQPCEDCDG